MNLFNAIKYSGCACIAEIGLNHNGDIETACSMVKAAAKSGAHAVKFQVFVPELLNSPYASDLLSCGMENARDYTTIDFFKKHTLAPDEYRRAFSAAEECGIVPFASVFDLPSLELMELFGSRFYKLASSEVTNLPLIKAVSGTGKPCILSTGMCSEAEIAMAVDTFRSGSGSEIALMHCVSLYPLPPAEANLNRIGSLARTFSCRVGYSDHTKGLTAAISAAAMGACMIEKHFTLDRDISCPDQDISLDPAGFRAMADAVKEASEMPGSGSIQFGEAEAATARAARRSLFAAVDIVRGEEISPKNLVALRPGVGISPAEIEDITGRRAAIDIAKDMMIREEYLSRRED
jgi:N,N'-diacetyllegionaminate synthase